jgi:hypothetical protein
MDFFDPFYLIHSIESTGAFSRFFFFVAFQVFALTVITVRVHEVNESILGMSLLPFSFQYKLVLCRSVGIWKEGLFFLDQPY